MKKLTFFFFVILSAKISGEAMHGLLSQVLKDLVFNQSGSQRT